MSPRSGVRTRMTEQEQRSVETAYQSFASAMREHDFGEPVDPDAWPAELIAAHVILTNDLLTDAARSVASGDDPVVDTEAAHQGEQLREILVRTGALPELAHEVERSAADLQAAYDQLSDEQRQTSLRTRMFHNGAVVVDEPRPIGDTIGNTAPAHAQDHLAQLLHLKDD